MKILIRNDFPEAAALSQAPGYDTKLWPPKMSAFLALDRFAPTHIITGQEPTKDLTDRLAESPEIEVIQYKEGPCVDPTLPREMFENSEFTFEIDHAYVINRDEEFVQVPPLKNGVTAHTIAFYKTKLPVDIKIAQENFYGLARNYGQVHFFSNCKAALDIQYRVGNVVGAPSKEEIMANYLPQHRLEQIFKNE